ncbi:MAG: B12-binding domain-containing radical SAM protein [Magnetococcales bacterium]|nr:B12-binding domain-containing radical SAM protein [Magnetococcales bacterium]
MNTVTFVTYLTREMELMPVGVLTLATLARERGWEVAVQDLPAPQDEEAFIHHLAASRIVGFSTLCSTFHRSLQLAARVKALHPQVTVIMGGPQATAVAVPLLERHAYVDLIFRGEAEAGWSAFLDGLPWSEIPGLVYRQHDAIQENPTAPLLMELDRLPWPAFDLYPPSGLSVPLETGRGCPFACTYCSTNQYFSRRFRAKSPERILAEMDQLHTLYGTRTFDLIEDSFTTNRRKILEFCDAIRIHPRAYAWNISARPDQVDAELLENLRRSGCRGIFFGIETGSQRMQKAVKKNLRVGRAVDNLALTRQSGLQVTASFIIGFPDETKEDLRETLQVFARLVSQQEMVLQLHLLSPLAGSTLVQAATPLAFDGMPTDFNDLDQRCSPTELAQLQQDPVLFPHMHYFSNTELPRARYLFVAYLIRLCEWFFPNFLHWVCQWRAASWTDCLLETPVPDEMVTDASFPEPTELWIERGHAVCARFARNSDLVGLQEILAYDRAFSRMNQLPNEPPAMVMLPRSLAERHPGRLLPTLTPPLNDLAPFLINREASGWVDVALQVTPEAMETRLQEICGNCGECCLDENGLMCGVEEWAMIARFLENHQQPVPATTPTAWQGLVLEAGFRYLAHPIDGPRTLHDTPEIARAAAGEQGWVRHACAHLEVENDLCRCGIQSVKPSECIAYPYRPMGDGGQIWHFEPTEGRLGGRCDLMALLKKRAAFRQQYLDWARSRMGPHSGAVALGQLHADHDLDQEQRA